MVPFVPVVGMLALVPAPAIGKGRTATLSCTEVATDVPILTALTFGKDGPSGPSATSSSPAGSRCSMSEDAGRSTVPQPFC